MYRPVKQRRVEHFASRSKWLSAGSVLQEFRHGDLFRADLWAGYWTARWRNHDAMARLTARQRNHSNVTANNAHEYFKRAYFLPFIDSVLYRSTRRAFHSSKSCCLPAKCVFTSFFNIAVNTTTSGRQQPNRTDSFCRTVVSLRWRRNTCGGSRQQYWEGQKIHREETWLCQKRFELQQNL